MSWKVWLAIGLQSAFILVLWVRLVRVEQVLSAWSRRKG